MSAVFSYLLSFDALQELSLNVFYSYVLFIGLLNNVALRIVLILLLLCDWFVIS